MIPTKQCKTILNFLIFLSVIALSNDVEGSEFKVFINNSLLKSDDSITVLEGSVVVYDIHQVNDLPIEFDLTGEGNLVQQLTGRNARLVTTYNSGDYKPEIIIGKESKGFKLSVKKANSKLFELLSKTAWPIVILILFFVLFIWGGLRQLLNRFSPTTLEFGKIKIEASDLTKKIADEVEKTTERMNMIFSGEISSRFLPSSLYKKISYYVHIFEFLSTIGISIENSIAFNIMGTYYFNSDPEKAEHAYERAISLASDDPRGYANLGMLYRLKKKDLNLANQNFSRAIKISETTNRPCPIAYMGLASVEKALEGDEKKVKLNLKKAIEQFERALVDNSSDFWSHFGIAWCLSYAEIDLDRAIKSSEVALKLKDDFFAAQYNLACNKAKKNDAESSIGSLMKILAPAIEELRIMEFENDPDFKTISDQKIFKDFCNFLGFQYTQTK